MPTLVIVGAQWGDEAKGKLVDALATDAELVVRYAGGNNAGHTVIVGDREFKFQLIPSGILHERTVSVLASGMVICPKSLLEELCRTKKLQPNIGTLRISSAAHVVFPYHLKLDALEEEARGANRIGTTSRGIGPAYQDKVARIGIRMGEFVDPKRFPERLKEVLVVKNRLLQLLGGEPLAYEELLAEFSAYAAQIRPYVTDTDIIVQEAVYGGNRVLFEGAQGTFLDLDHGTYPFVTSSHPLSGGACLGTGIGPRAIENVIGVCKAYTTRVGSGPFPTEQDNETGEWIRRHGKEFGTVTGRSRRCGWLDAVVLRQSARINSLSGWAVTRLDILSVFDEVQIGTRYLLDGAPIDHMPTDLEVFGRCVPVFETLPGWKDADLRGCRTLADLPPNARAYLDFIEAQTGVPVAMVSVGPDRAETIMIRPDLVWG